MPTASLNASLGLLFSELTDGATDRSAYMLNAGDIGLLKSLDKLTAAAASKSSDRSSATIAAHTDHIRFGLELMNRWQDGEANPWATADWGQSWKITTVTSTEWQQSRAALRDQVKRWRKAIQKPRSMSGQALNGLIASVAHLAYHLGAIRQIERKARGPKDTTA
jgi:hypothetical protein